MLFLAVINFLSLTFLFNLYFKVKVDIGKIWVYITDCDKLRLTKYISNVFELSRYVGQLPTGFKVDLIQF